MTMKTTTLILTIAVLAAGAATAADRTVLVEYFTADG
jgi:hypothetical protein